MNKELLLDGFTVIESSSKIIKRMIENESMQDLFKEHLERTINLITSELLAIREEFNGTK